MEFYADFRAILRPLGAVFRENPWKIAQSTFISAFQRCKERLKIPTTAEVIKVWNQVVDFTECAEELTRG